MKNKVPLIFLCSALAKGDNFPKIGATFTKESLNQIWLNFSFVTSA
jgi:hypothetical protein